MSYVSLIIGIVIGYLLGFMSLMIIGLTRYTHGQQETQRETHVRDLYPKK